MRVNELARATCVAPHVIRYYSRIGLLGPRREPGNRYRNYAKADIARLRFIRGAKALGFSLKDVKTILNAADAASEPCQEVRRIISIRADKNHERLEQLEQLNCRFARAVAKLETQTNETPPGQHLRDFVKSIARMESGLT